MGGNAAQASVARAAGAARSQAKPRIGYVSSFFGARNWMKMSIRVINAHDRDRFEFHFLATADAVGGGRLRDHPDDRIWDIGDISNAELASMSPTPGWTCWWI